MVRSTIHFCRWVIEYGFYAIFFLVPLVFASDTSELFELNKIWLLYAITLVIALAWFSKMTMQRQIRIQRTVLDIPLLLFLASQIISTIFSLDQRISFWGYYSRFNGGLLSTMVYIFLYYAFGSNLKLKHVIRLIYVSIASCIVVALWGLPSHFGYDPTCLLFRGKFDISCWTDAFYPPDRIFSTLGQPAWLAAYLSVILPLVMALILPINKKLNAKLSVIRSLLFAIIIILFYVDLIFSNTRAGFIGFCLGNIVFWLILFIRRVFSFKQFLLFFVGVNFLLLACNFFVGSPFNQFDKFTFSHLKASMIASHPDTTTITKHATPTPASAPATPPVGSALETGGTDSGIIREIVWKGGIAAWEHNQLFGTGVETFAFAYYQYRPVEHNMTSEWDYLYNKAHNEYINYLTTTGIFGLGSYLAFIGLFFFVTFRICFTHKAKSVEQMDSISTRSLLFIIALVGSYISMLVSNFFGFSVVIINLYIFLIPAFVLILGEKIEKKYILYRFNKEASIVEHVNPYQWTFLTIFVLSCSVMLFLLGKYYLADKEYALGYNLDRVNDAQTAYPHLKKAVDMRPAEPIFKDELAANMATLAVDLLQQKDTTNASNFAEQAIAMDNEIVKDHPNNVTFWKTRVRIFYTLGQANSTYLSQALEAIKKAHQLAPTDAKIMYNLGVLYAQTGDIQQGVTVLQQTIQAKPDYRDAYYALGLFYHQLALAPKSDKKIANPEMQQKAVASLEYILKNLIPNDADTLKTLKSWETN